MKFALVCGKRTEATKGARGICPCCSSDVIAKCGQVKVNHWAHHGTRNCDIWWENETEWHREWKNNYPDDWQEITLHDDQSGEKHVADVRTSHDLVIEFQHSHIDQLEIKAREKFYKNMVWVVDGTRLKRDYPRFLKGINNLRKTNKPGHYVVDFPNKVFPTAWLGSSVPIIFDFLGLESLDDPNDLRNMLYLMFPKQQNKKTILAITSRESFVNTTINGPLFEKLQDPVKQDSNPQAVKKKTAKRRESQYIYERGRWRKRYPRL